mgnify:CR=1 FL=1
MNIRRPVEDPWTSMYHQFQRLLQLFRLIQKKNIFWNWIFVAQQRFIESHCNVFKPKIFLSYNKVWIVIDFIITRMKLYWAMCVAS